MNTYCYARHCDNNQGFSPVCMYEKAMPCRVVCETCEYKCKKQNYACNKYKRKGGNK